MQHIQREAKFTYKEKYVSIFIYYMHTKKMQLFVSPEFIMTFLYP